VDRTKPKAGRLFVDGQRLGAALMKQAEDLAREKGDRQIGLQVFQQNQPALNLYENLGYTVQSLWMTKTL
jgi:ribosomal protein S18 acetylase RimI-like enzyme